MNMKQATLFVTLWQLAPSVDVVAAALGLSARAVVRRARHLHQAGVRLKDMPDCRSLSVLGVNPSAN